MRKALRFFVVSLLFIRSLGFFFELKLPFLFLQFGSRDFPFFKSCAVVKEIGRDDQNP